MGKVGRAPGMKVTQVTGFPAQIAKDLKAKKYELQKAKQRMKGKKGDALEKAEKDVSDLEAEIEVLVAAGARENFQETKSLYLCFFL